MIKGFTLCRLFMKFIKFGISNQYATDTNLYVVYLI